MLHNSLQACGAKGADLAVRFAPAPGEEIAPAARRGDPDPMHEPKPAPNFQEAPEPEPEQTSENPMGGGA